MTRYWRRNWVVLIVAGFHFAWGAILPFDPAPLRTTPMAHFPIQVPWVAGFAYLGISVLAIFPHLEISGRLSRSGQRLDTCYKGLLFTLPQMFLLMLSFFTAMRAILEGAYPDGYIPDKYGSPHLFILVDQLPYMSLAAGHVFTLLDWYVWSRR